MLLSNVNMIMLLCNNNMMHIGAILAAECHTTVPTISSQLLFANILGGPPKTFHYSSRALKY